MMMGSSSDETRTKSRTVLPETFGGGPHGLGDPNDKTLRRVEIETLIPKKLRVKAKEEKCKSQVKAFEECSKAHGVAMVVKCRKENSELRACLEHWYQDEDLRKACTEEYLAERSEYRRTGKKTPFKRM